MNPCRFHIVSGAGVDQVAEARQVTHGFSDMVKIVV
jgi:hypothetical protein